MPSSHTGHFVSIWRPVTPHNQVSPEFVPVAGRMVSTTINQWRFDRQDGWAPVSREMPLRRAKKFARAYRQAGFPTRVYFDGHGVYKLVLDLKPARKAARR